MSKTRKRVLSVLAILFAAALVFTACLALTGCGDSDDGDTGTTWPAELTITGSSFFEDGTKAYQYPASYDGSSAMMDRTTSDVTDDDGNVIETVTNVFYVFVFENGEIIFGIESDYDTYLSAHQSMATNGTWTYEDGELTIDAGNTADVVPNADGTVTVTVVSGTFGTYVATINPSDFAA